MQPFFYKFFFENFIASLEVSQKAAKKIGPINECKLGLGTAWMNNGFILMKVGMKTFCLFSQILQQQISR